MNHQDTEEKALPSGVCFILIQQTIGYHCTHTQEVDEAWKQLFHVYIGLAMLALLNVTLTQKNHWITAETEWTLRFFSVNIVELLSRARISSRSLIFTF